MKTISRLALMLAPLVLVACHKKDAPAVAVPPVELAAPAPAAAPPAAAPAAMDPEKMSAEQKELAQRQTKLDFGVMEDKYINDPKAQWASSASASSSYGRTEPSDNYLPSKVVGAPDNYFWMNKNDDIGFEWVQAEYAKPVNATEVRLVVAGGTGVEALNKVELQDTEGKWYTVWTGLSDVKEDERGPRTWFVRTFPKTAYKVKAVKYTVANNVKAGEKKFDAAQLVGE